MPALVLPDPLGAALMRWKKKDRPVWDNRTARPEPLVVETMETLSGPGPCAKCAGPKFEHTPYGGISHAFVSRDPVLRAVAAAKNSERRR